MSHTDLCPTCHAAPLASDEGHLEQSGSTFLPTRRWSCAVCGYARLEPALGVKWRAEPAAPVLVISLQAA